MMVCRECKAFSRPDDVFCHACGARLEDVRLRKGRDRFFASLFVIVAYPLFQSFVTIFASMANSAKVENTTYLEVLLEFAMALCFYLAFRGHNRAKTPIIAYAFLVGGLYIANASVILFTRGMDLTLTGWFISGGLYLWVGLVMLRSREVDVYILSKML